VKKNTAKERGRARENGWSVGWHHNKCISTKSPVVFNSKIGTLMELKKSKSYSITSELT
jgi:hypothetical protein